MSKQCGKEVGESQTTNGPNKWFCLLPEGHTGPCGMNVGTVLSGPKFTHDCKVCIFLGRHTDSEGDHDLYYHKGESDFDQRFPTLVARFGNQDSHYRSMSVDSNTLKLFARDSSYVLAVAYRAAQIVGYIKGDPNV